MSAIASALRKNLIFLKEHKDKIILFDLHQSIEKCYYAFILFPAVEEFYCLTILMKIIIGTAIRICNESLEVNKCSIEI